MTILTRYILSEFLKVFLIALAGMSVLMLIVGLAQEAIRQGLGPQPILRLIPYAVPNALRFAVPGTMLFAACSLFGRMSANNEVVALKSLGISPLRIITPALTLAFLISLVAVWLNDVAVSWGRIGMERVVLHSVEQIIYGMLRSQRSYSTRRFSVNVKDVQDRTLLRPMIAFHADGDQPPIMLTADQAELRLNVEQGILSILLTDGEVTVGDQLSMVFPHTIEREIPLREASRRGSVATSPSNYPMWSLAPSIEEQQDRIEKLRRELALDATSALVLGELPVLSDPDWESRLEQLASAKERLHRLQTEPWRRWANGFSCLFFVFVGAPLAIRMRNADIWTTFATVFLPILLIYYPLLAYGVDRSKAGDVAPILVWMGNLFLGGLGLWLLRQTIRY